MIKGNFHSLVGTKAVGSSGNHSDFVVETLNGAIGDFSFGSKPIQDVRGGGRGYQNGGPLFANLAPRLSLFSDPLRTVLAVKGSLRRAQQRRALDRSGPFRTTLLRRGKGSLRTAPLAGDHFAAILVPFFAATDIQDQRLMGA